jgi:predicted Zn-dependent protease
MNRRLAPIILLCSLPWLALCKSAIAQDAPGSDQTGNQRIARWSIYSRDQEEKAGEKLARKIEQSDFLLSDPVVLGYVNRVAQRVLASSNCDQRVTVKVLLDPAFNAFSLPGGRIYLTVGLLRRIGTEDELAVVLAHEIAHVAARDWGNQRSKGIVLRMGEWTLPWLIPFGGLADLGYQRAMPGVLNDFSRRAEEDADSRSLEYLYKAGYDPAAFVSFLRKASRIDENDAQLAHRDNKDELQLANRIAKAERKVSQLPKRRAPTSAAPQEFAQTQQRLPDIGEGQEATRMALNPARKSRRISMTVEPKIDEPKEIRSFLKDETPPTLKWNDSRQTEDNDD